MRIVGSVSLVLAGVVLGLFGVLMLGATGIHWVGGLVVPQLSDSDDTERAIGIGMGIAGLGGWAVLATAGGFVGLRGPRPSRARSVSVWVALALSVAILVGAMTFVLLVNDR